MGLGEGEEGSTNVTGVGGYLEENVCKKGALLRSVPIGQKLAREALLIQLKLHMAS